MSDLAKYFHGVWNGEHRAFKDRLLMAALSMLSFPYASALRARSLAYAAGLMPSRRLSKPVVSVGNLTVGGTGKTPMTVFLARWFIGRGKRVTVLSRGYGGSLEGDTRIVSDGSSMFLTPDEAGDEPCLIASSVQGLSVVIGTDRYRAGLLALEKFDPDIFILDDGFQHLRLERDLNILLLDCAKPFGNGRVFPAGTLREPVSAEERADLVIYSRCKCKGHPQHDKKPSCASTHRLTGALPLSGGERIPFPSIQGLRGLAFAGIADPEYFFHSLEQEGLQLAGTIGFPDHCRYGFEEIDSISCSRLSSGADYLVTTGKDAVKLLPYLEKLGTVYVADLEVCFPDPRPLDHELGKLL